MDIRNKKVTGDEDFLYFLFPNYEKYTEVPMFPTKPGIFISNYEKRDEDRFAQKYIERGLDFIIYIKSGRTCYNLNSRLILLSVVFGKYNRYIPKYVREVERQLDDETFYYLCKIYWVTGTWLVKKIDYEKTFLDFIYSFSSSKRDIMATFFKVVKETRVFRLESSLLTFLLRVQNQDYRGSSVVYIRQIKSFSGKKLELVKKGIEKSLKTNIDNYELRFLNMLIVMMDQK